MYKSTRHTNKAWTYANSSLRSPWTGTEEEGRKVVSNSRAKLFQMKLLRPDEYHFPNPPPAQLFTYGRLVNDRIRSGSSFLRKHYFPDALIRALPNYFIIAPKLGAVLSRLQRKSLHQVPTELQELFHYLQAHGAPPSPTARPVFSESAVRVKAADVVQSVDKSKAGTVRAPRVQKAAPKPAPKKQPQAMPVAKQGKRKPADLRNLQVDGNTAIALALQAAIRRK